jgi:hypothetical protein
MQCKPLWKLNAIFAMLLTTACSYSVSVNDRVVYTPEPIFSDYHISDRALAVCLEHHIVDQKITRAFDLKRLDCSDAGIASLAGLEIFDGLEELNLANNQLRDLQPLSRLQQLQLLILRENPLTTIAPLLSLLQLRSLDLTDVLLTSCTDLQQLEKNWEGLTVDLIKPQACQ